MPRRRCCCCNRFYINGYSPNYWIDIKSVYSEKFTNNSADYWTIGAMSFDHYSKMSYNIKSLTASSSRLESADVDIHGKATVKDTTLGSLSRLVTDGEAGYAWALGRQNSGTINECRIVKIALDGSTASSIWSHTESGQPEDQSNFGSMAISRDSALLFVALNIVQYSSFPTLSAITWDIRSIATDGTGETTIYTAPDFGSGINPHTIMQVAVDNTNSKVWWTERKGVTNWYVKRCNFDGSSPETMVSATDRWIGPIQWSHAQQRIYYLDYGYSGGNVASATDTTHGLKSNNFACTDEQLVLARSATNTEPATQNWSSVSGTNAVQEIRLGCGPESLGASTAA